MEWAGKYPYAYPRWIGGFVAFLITNHPDYARTLFGRGGKLITCYCRKFSILHSAFQQQDFQSPLHACLFFPTWQAIISCPPQKRLDGGIKLWVGQLLEVMRRYQPSMSSIFIGWLQRLWRPWSHNGDAHMEVGYFELSPSLVRHILPGEKAFCFCSHLHLYKAWQSVHTQ